MLLTARARALSVLAHAWSRGPTTCSELPFRVSAFDVDLNLHLTNSRYPQLMDAGRLDLLLRSGVAWSLARSGVRPVVVQCTLNFRKELRWGARFVLRTRCMGKQRRAAVFEQVFLVGEEVHASAEVRVLCLKAGGVTQPDLLAPLWQVGQQASAGAGP